MDPGRGSLTKCRAPRLGEPAPSSLPDEGSNGDQQQSRSNANAVCGKVRQTHGPLDCRDALQKFDGDAAGEQPCGGDPCAGALEGQRTQHCQNEERRGME